MNYNQDAVKAAIAQRQADEHAEITSHCEEAIAKYPVGTVIVYQGKDGSVLHKRRVVGYGITKHWTGEIWPCLKTLLTEEYVNLGNGNRKSNDTLSIPVREIDSGYIKE